MSTEGKPTVLVVDDDVTVNKLITRFLTHHGYQVQSASDGQEAREIFQAGVHEVVISDIRMPRMDGWQLAAALHLIAPKLPILLMTAYSNTGSGSWNQDFLRKNGIVKILGKPIDFPFLKQILEDIQHGRI